MKPRIEKETGLNPLLTAQRVVAEVAAELKLEFPPELSERLADQAELSYRTVAPIRAEWRDNPFEEGQRHLAGFMRWWLPATVWKLSPELGRQLPTDFLNMAEP